MAALNRLVNAYVKDDRGLARRWEWGRCDCIGLLFHLVGSASGREHLRRDAYLPSDLGYEDAIRWLHDANPDPLVPYLKYIVDDAGIPVHRGSDWNLAIIADTKPLPVIGGGVYPIDIVPGVAVVFEGVPHVLAKRGLASVNLYPTELKDFVGFKLRVE